DLQVELGTCGELVGRHRQVPGAKRAGLAVVGDDAVGAAAVPAVLPAQDDGGVVAERHTAAKSPGADAGAVGEQGPAVVGRPKGAELEVQLVAGGAGGREEKREQEGGKHDHSSSRVDKVSSANRPSVA